MSVLCPKFWRFVRVRGCYKYMFLSSNDFSMIMVWWFESGMIVWLRCDGLYVVCVSEELQTVVKGAHTLFLVFFKLRNITQSTSLSFRSLQLFHIGKWLESILKTSEDQVIKPSVVIRFDVVYPGVSLKTLNDYQMARKKQLSKWNRVH